MAKDTLGQIMDTRWRKLRGGGGRVGGCAGGSNALNQSESRRSATGCLAQADNYLKGWGRSMTETSLVTVVRAGLRPGSTPPRPLESWRVSYPFQSEALAWVV
jgi:hypothetical protein